MPIAGGGKCAHIRIAELFAGKEAVLKALGTGLRRNMHWTDVEILTGPDRGTNIELHGAVGARARRSGFFDPDATLSLTLSHDRRIAIAAFVALRSVEQPRPAWDA